METQKNSPPAPLTPHRSAQRLPAKRQQPATPARADRDLSIAYNTTSPSGEVPLLLQLQAYWTQTAPFAPQPMLAGELFTCHDRADLEALRALLAGKQAPLVYRIERDGPHVARVPVDLDGLIAEIE